MKLLKDGKKIFQRLLNMKSYLKKLEIMLKELKNYQESQSVGLELDHKEKQLSTKKLTDSNIYDRVIEYKF